MYRNRDALYALRVRITCGGRAQATAFVVHIAAPLLANAIEMLSIHFKLDGGKFTHVLLICANNRISAQTY